MEAFFLIHKQLFLENLFLSLWVCFGDGNEKKRAAVVIFFLAKTEFIFFCFTQIGNLLNKSRTGNN